MYYIRLILLDLGTNLIYEHSPGTELIYKLGTYYMLCEKLNKAFKMFYNLICHIPCSASFEYQQLTDTIPDGVHICRTDFSFCGHKIVIGFMFLAKVHVECLNAERARGR